MKKFTKFLAMAVTFTAFLLTSCGGITGTFEDQTNDTSPTVTETRNVNFTADSNGLFSFPTKSNSRTILPGEVETNKLDFYLVYKDTVNSTDSLYTKIDFIKSEQSTTGSVKRGSFSLPFTLSDYQFSLYAVPNGTKISDNNGVSDISSKSLFVGTANADLRFNDEVTFHMKANSSSTGQGSINITLTHENDWTIPKGYKVTVGLYNVDDKNDTPKYPTGTAQELIDATSGDKTMGSQVFKCTDPVIPQGEYNLVVKYNKFASDGNTLEKTFEYSEKVIILMNQTSTGTVIIPEILDKKPAAPANFKAQFKDPKDSTKNSYEVNFTWEDKSNNEREFIIDLLTLADATDYLKLPATDDEWSAINQTPVSYNRATFDTADNKVNGSLNKGNTSATFYLELEKRYIARICASNDAGKSDWVYLTWQDAVTNDWQAFESSVQTINRFRITYNLNGGNFAAADPDGGSVANPPALVYYASQHTTFPETTPAVPAASTTHNVILSPDGITTQNWVTNIKGKDTIETATAITLTKEGNYFLKWTKGAEGGTDYDTTVTVENKPATFVKNIKYYPSTATKEILGFLSTQPTKATYGDPAFADIKVRKAASNLYTGFKNLDLVANYDTTRNITVEIDDITLYELKPSFFALDYAKDTKALEDAAPIDSETTKTVADVKSLTLGGTDEKPIKLLEVSTAKVDKITITANTSNVIPITQYNPNTKEIEITYGDYTKMHLTIKAVVGNSVLVNADRDTNSKWEVSFKNWKTGKYNCEITANTDQIPNQTLSYVFTLSITQ